MTTWARDYDTHLMAARELAVRFDPEKEMVWYFAKGYPEKYKAFWTKPNGIVDQTNAIFEKSGAKVRLVVKNYDQDMPDGITEKERARGREYGDVRYNFIRWMSDIDVGAPFIGVAQFVPDPRTGEGPQRLHQHGGLPSQGVRGPAHGRVHADHHVPRLREGAGRHRRLRRHQLGQALGPPHARGRGDPSGWRQGDSAQADA